MDAHEALVEKVASTIDREAFTDDTPISFKGHMRDDARARARAALSVVAEALREPTEAMEKAWGDCDHSETAADDWRVMLSASPLYPKKDGGNG